MNYIIEYNLHGIETWKESFTNSEYTFAIYCKFLNVLGLKERGFLIATAILFAMLLMIALHVNHCDKILIFIVLFCRTISSVILYYTAKSSDCYCSDFI